MNVGVATEIDMHAEKPNVALFCRSHAHGFTITLRESNLKRILSKKLRISNGQLCESRLPPSKRSPCRRTSADLEARCRSGRGRKWPESGEDDSKKTSEIWRCPEIWGTPSYHPFIDGLSIINYPFWGTTFLGNPI